MSDAATRATERAATNDPAARVRALGERLRRGELSRERVVLAARLGDETALEVVGEPETARCDWSRWYDRRFFVRSVAEAVGGREWRRPLAAWSCDVAERVLPLFEKHSKSKAPRTCIAAVRAWIDCPCDDHLAQVRKARDDAWRARWPATATATAAADAADAAAATATAATAAADAADAAAATADATAADAAADATAAAAAAAARASEFEWSRRRLIAYALGEVVA